VNERPHGWVLPNPDGSKARCGGPHLCRQCQRELAKLCATHSPLTETYELVLRAGVMSGKPLRPGEAAQLFAEIDLLRAKLRSMGVEP